MIKYGKNNTPVARPVLSGLELTLLIEHLLATDFEGSYKNIYMIKGKIKPPEKTPTVAQDIMKKLRVSLARLEIEND